MPLWGNKDTANNKPKFVGSANVAKVSGVTVAEAQADKGIAQPGWVQTTLGTGGVASIAVTTPGTGYANGDVVAAANTYGDGFAGTVRTNGAGAVSSIAVTSPGQYTQAPALTITSTAGNNAVLAATVGGRAGRKFSETLVALGSMSN
jgi:hypothetical protein